MTLLLGGRCNDGVVIVAELYMKITSKATGQDPFEYEGK
jgi:hypothetical protein